jgi:hypothetical protein
MNPQSKVSTKWSHKLAYVIGLLATDGCLYKDGRHIDFTSQDIQLIETFKNCLNIKNKIGFKASGTSIKKCPHIQFGDILFYKWLLRIGITPHKSKTIADIKIPDKYFFDFLRGHFDGDGCCFSYWDKRWHSSFMFYLTFVSASEKHISWLKAKIKEFTNVNGYLGRSQKSSVYQLRYAKKESQILISKMYYKKDLPCLFRKYKKIKSVLEINEQSLKN